MTPLLQRRVQWLPFAAAVPVGLLCGAVVATKLTLAAALAVMIVGVLALYLLQERAFVAAIVLIAVAPWYPFVNDASVPPLVPQVVFCGAIGAATVLPWLWVVAGKPSLEPPSRLVLLYALLFPCLALAIFFSITVRKDLVSTQIFGLLFGGVAFIFARRLGRTDTWPVVSFLGLSALVLMGLAAYVQSPDLRIGSFTGYPITYGALVVGLLPGAVVYALRRSRLLAIVLAMGAGAVLIFSESRSSWIASIVMLLVVIALLFRLKRWKELGAVAFVTVIAAVAVVASGSLSGIVERKLGPDVKKSDSVVHRVYSYGYAAGRIRDKPVFGAAIPGYAAEQAQEETGIGALDNGYLSVTVDTGLFGLIAVLVPIGLALLLVGRCLVGREQPTADDAALALGIIGMAVVTIFYDSFYWAQICLLLFSMGGTLSRRPAPARAPARVPAAPQRTPAGAETELSLVAS